jgi:transcriptional antiterminator RfaH
VTVGEERREDGGAGREEGAKWYAIYTKPKAEDSTATLLSRAGIETFNPKIKVRKYGRKKYIDVIEQLFPSYVFALFDPGKHGHMISYTRGVRYVVGGEIPIAVPDEIILMIRQRMVDGVVKPEPVDLSSGDKVMISEGPFKDFYGIFERNLSGKERAMILLEALHCKLEIELHMLKKI